RSGHGGSRGGKWRGGGGDASSRKNRSGRRHRRRHDRVFRELPGFGGTSRSGARKNPARSGRRLRQESDAKSPRPRGDGGIAGEIRASRPDRGFAQKLS